MPMNVHIRNQPNFFAGMLFAILGTGFSYGATRYDVGTAAQMGPGFFPLVLGGLLALLGVAIVLHSLIPQDEEVIERAPLKPLILILGAVTLFALLLIPLGLILASVVLILASAFASHEFAWRYVVITMLVLIVLCYIVFIYGLGLPIPVWPRGF
jgi:hypothetical protein